MRFDLTLFSVHSCSKGETDGGQRFRDCNNKFTSVTTLSGRFFSLCVVCRSRALLSARAYISTGNKYMY